MHHLSNFIITWLIVIILNQVFFFNSCFKFYCIENALMHTSIFSIIIYFILKTNLQDKHNDSSKIINTNTLDSSANNIKKIQTNKRPKNNKKYSPDKDLDMFNDELKIGLSNKDNNSKKDTTTNNTKNVKKTYKKPKNNKKNPPDIDIDFDFDFDLDMLFNDEPSFLDVWENELEKKLSNKGDNSKKDIVRNRTNNIKKRQIRNNNSSTYSETNINKFRGTTKFFFDNAQEAQEYAKKHIGSIVRRNPDKNSGFIVEINKNSKLYIKNNIYHINTYHPYRGGNNPNFNDFSEKILELKNNDSLSDYFFDILKKSIWNNIDTIVIVPSHDPYKKQSSIKRLAKRLAGYFKFIDGTDVIIRTHKIDKLSKGGNRDIYIHLNSLKVQSHHLINNNNVLVLDDVATSGNSLKAVENLLIGNGAKSVLLCALGYTE